MDNLLDFIETWVGVHEWELLEFNGVQFCVPNLNWCLKAVFLLLFTYIFIKSFFNFIKTLH